MFDENTALLKAAGIVLPPGADEYEIIEKILADNFVNQAVLQFLVKKYAAEALVTRHELEKKHLRTRLRVEEVPTKHKVEWAIVSPDASESGKLTIRATCGAETIVWAGSAQDLRTLKFRGKSVPGDVAAVYAAHYGTGDDPEIVAARADFLAREQKKKDLNKAGHGWVSSNAAQ